MRTDNPDIPNILNSPALGMQLSSGAAVPLVLFPVKLETRFFPLADGNSELRVRVYPDTAHIDTHEPALTAEEVTWGQHFWTQTWRAGNNEERSKAAWQQLADRFDPPRAAWIAQALKPLNPEDRPANSIAGDQALPKPVRFPSPATQPEPWMRPPITRVLPNFWVLLGYKSGQLVVNVKGGPIRDPLPTGPDPSPNAKLDEIGIDQGIKWMIDFNAAEEAGMGIRAKLSKEQASAGLDFLLALGVKDFPVDTKEPATRLAELFTAHHYTTGLSFITPGTPSNNTADTPSGFSSEDPGHEASYEAERISQSFRPGDESNFDTLTTALGLMNVDTGFSRLAHAAAKDQLDARQMNTALWQATWGYFLLHILGDRQKGESPLADDDIAWARKHFIDHVRASGPLPSIRIGKQPYGVLPVTSLDLWKAPLDTQFNRDRALQGFLISLRKIWRGNFPEVPRLGRTDDIDQEKGIDKDLIEVLHMDGLSSNYSLRNLIGRHYLEHLWVFLSADPMKAAWEMPDPEPPPVEEPPEPPDVEGLSKTARAAALAAHRKAVADFNKRHEQAQRAFAAAAARKRVIIEGNRAAVTAWWTTQEQLATAVFKTLEVSWRPRVSRAVFAPPVATLRGPLVQADHSSSLSPNYIEQLLAARDLVKEAPFVNQLKQPPPHTLLHLLLRQSMLLEYTTAARRLFGRTLTAEERREPELVDLPTGQWAQTFRSHLEMKINVIGRGLVDAHEFVLPASGDPDVTKDPLLKQIKDFRASLDHLKTLSVNQLERLMTGTLDLCSHRLDAWITSFATKRLAEMRKANPTAVLFGGYGWVMNLKPAEAQTKVTVPGEPEPVIQLADNPGFTHTPSLTQASTAAILRSAHLTHAAAAKKPQNDLLAIDLSSERVRLATWLLDGVRQGQPLGALLGYRFERRLQEASLQEPGLAEFIPAFRELAPLVARKLDQPASSGPVEAIAANNVVDGLVLFRRWQKATSTNPPQWTKETVPFGQQVGQQPIKLPPPGDRKFDRLQTELAVLADSVDAVSDALMAEGMYQLVRGNPLRAGTTVESIAGGETPPPDLEVVRTPRSGIAITHRLLTLFSGKTGLPPGWASSENSFRAKAEPNLNAWAAKLLGKPANVRCVIEHIEQATGNVLESKELRLDQLQLAPLDLVYAIEGGQDGQGEIEQRILYTITRSQDGFAPGSLLRVSRDRKADWKNNELSYGEFSELLRTARKLLAGVRGIDDNDLNLPERNAAANVDISELNQRAIKAAGALNDTLKKLTALLATPDTANLESIRDSILLSASFGIAGAVPLSAAGDSAADREVLLAQAGSIQKELAQRASQLAALTGTDAIAEMARLRAVFGKAFVVLPRFSSANVAELQNALAASTKIQDGDPLAAITWFQRMARVRSGVSKFSAVLNYSEILNTGEKLNLNIAQLPFSSTDRWVGLPLKDGQSMPAGKLSLVVQSAAAIDITKPLAGLLIDEWVEVVPSTTEITGLAFQYDQPNAAPPQTILLAVPPEIGTPWTILSLQQVLLETLDLARIRAVDSEALDEVNHYLPALYFACNVAGDTVSTDFTTIK